MAPIAIDLCAGRFGWGRGLVAAGFRVIGVDLAWPRRIPAPAGCTRVTQDIRTLDGRQFRRAALIVASPPCQEFSRLEFPWHRDKLEPDLGIVLFRTCQRIIAEAGVPGIIENVRAAQRWVGQAEAHFGSFYLWGDIPLLRPQGMSFVKGCYASRKNGPSAWNRPHHLGNGVRSPALRAVIPFDLAYWIGCSFSQTT